MVRRAHHERLELPLVLSSSKDALRSKRLLGVVQLFKGEEKGTGDFPEFDIDFRL
jgi:hypothetical protein